MATVKAITLFFLPFCSFSFSFFLLVLFVHSAVSEVQEDMAKVKAQILKSHPLVPKPVYLNQGTKLPQHT